MTTVLNSVARARYQKRLAGLIDDYLRRKQEETVPDPSPHDLSAGRHYPSVCRACIGRELELDALREVERTTPDPDVALLALIAVGSILFGGDDV